jgi:putative nucleotidyltransferase with HDIG domain
MGVEKLAAELEAVVTKRIGSDQLVLPTMPAVAIRVKQILDDPEAGMPEVAEALEKDPLLTARVLKMATSAAFAAGGKKATLQEALARLGAKTIKHLLVEAAAQQVFVSPRPKINAQLKVLWVHSVAVGAIARDVMSLTSGPDADGAYLAGLLHDVGKPVVATMLLELERQLTAADQRSWIETGEWLEVVARVHRPVGVALAERWQLPPETIACIKECKAYGEGEGSAFANAVCFGNALAKKTASYAGVVVPEENDALIASGRTLLGLSDEQLEGLTKGLVDRVAGLYA